MADRFLLRRGKAVGDPAEWALVDPSGMLRGEVQRGTLADAAAQVEGRAVTLAVSGTDVLLVDAKVPSTNKTRVLQALPYALEERVVDEVDNLHFALGMRQGEDVYPVAVAAKSLLEEWLEEMRTAGIQPQALVPEPLLLPRESGHWTLLIDGERAVVRQGDWEGFAIEADETLVSLLQSFQGEEDREDECQALDAFICGPLPQGLKDLSLPLERHAASSTLEVMAGGMNGLSINLLQGEFSRREQWGKYLRPWRLTAAILGGWLVINGVSEAMEYRRLKQQGARLTAQIEQLLRETFPDIRRVVNPRVQMTNRLRELKRQTGGEQGLIELLAGTAQAIGAADKASLAAANYRRGRLDLDLETDRPEVIDRLQKNIDQSPNLQAVIQSYRTERGRVSGRIRIQEASAPGQDASSTREASP
jgi:general secretion pathway protein L